MKSYISYFKIRFITNLQYRMDAIAGITTQIFFGLIFIMVYSLRTSQTKKNSSIFL